jgi:hypothetical protein
MDESIEQLTKKLADEGKLIEAGWLGLRLSVLPPTASPVQIIEMRKAFFAGAQHVFASLMELMGDDGGEPTAEDLHRLDLICDELSAFFVELKRENERGRRQRHPTHHRPKRRP